MFPYQLIEIARQADPDCEIAVMVYSIEKDGELAVCSYDIGYEYNEYGDLVLQIQI